MINISRLIKRAKIYGISEEVVRKIVNRDKDCIYCHKKMKFNSSLIGTPKNKATIEHFNEKYVYAAKEDGVGICCGSCNSSRSDNKLSYWFKTKYCLERNINQKTVAKPIKNYIKRSQKS